MLAEQLELWSAAARFPGELEPGETVDWYPDPSGEYAADDYVVTSVHGHQYRVTNRQWWDVARMPFAFAMSNGGYCWLGFDGTPQGVLSWIRRDSDSRILAAGRWARWGHLRRTVPFSLGLETEELEPGVMRVARYGIQGILADYPWGWEASPSGRLPESPNRRAADIGRLEYVAWQLTHRGFNGLPTSRLRVRRSYWRRDRDCATGGPNHLGSCKRTHPRFLVDVLDDAGVAMGSVILCAKHLGYRLGGSNGFYGPNFLTAVAKRLSGSTSWIDWQERLPELTWDLVAPAVDRGLPVPDVAAALIGEALEAGDQRARQSARRQAREQRLGKRAQEAAGEAALRERLARRGELIAEAEAAETFWRKWHQDL